jgi:hypothetical protein
MKTKRKPGLWVMLVVVVMGLLLAGSVAASQPGEPQPGTVQGLRGPSLFWEGVIAGSVTTYTTSPRTQFGTDVSMVWMYHSADIFVTADITPSGRITVTPQLSVDQVNWADAKYTYVADTLLSTTTVISTSGVTTATTTTAMDSAVTEATYQIVMTADGTDYLRMPVAGRYIRFKIEHSDVVTPTISVLLRND